MEAVCDVTVNGSKDQTGRLRRAALLNSHSYLVTCLSPSFASGAYACVCQCFPHSEGGGGGGGVGCPGNQRPLRVMNVPLQPGLLWMVSPNDPSHFTKWTRQRAVCCTNPSIRDSREKNIAHPWYILLFLPMPQSESAFCPGLFLF